jgi:hypothetical protein
VTETATLSRKAATVSALPAGFRIESMRLNGADSRRPLFVLYRTGVGAVASARTRSTLVRRAQEV